LYDALDALQIKHLNSATTPAIIYTYRPDRSIETMAVRQNGVTNTWTYGYDGANQLTAATLRNASQVILESNSYAYDKAGNRTQMGNTTTAPSNAEVNNLNQLLSLRDFGPTTFAGTVDEPATVTVNGQPARMTSNDGGAPYRFEAQVSLDAGTNLVSVQAKDGRNNTSTKNYSVSSSGAAKAFEYDGNGNLRFEKQPNGTVIREYQWDQQNRLVKLIAGTNESQFEYDGESRRTRIRELTNGTQTKDERFVWCGSRICQKRTGTTTVARRYFDNGFLQSTTKYFYTRDHLGSVREVVASNGTTVNARLVYDAWGKLTETGTVQSDFTYTGHYLHRPSALNLAQYRGYDAGLGRWLSRDPIGLAGGWNLYGYVDNSPVNYVDPSGEKKVCLPLSAFLTICFEWPEPTPRPGPDSCKDLPDNRSRPLKTTCKTKCAKVNPDGTGGGKCTGHVSGSATAGTKDEACKAAKSNANSNAGAEGCRADHCKPCDCD
jgi:RHS repeat-associated protein